jgi:predicted phage terminase large subunit-like protein
VRPQGGLFQAEWFEGSSIDPRELPERLSLCRYWDLAATDAARGRDPDHTAGVLLGRSNEGIWYVIDVSRCRSSPLEVERRVARTAERDAAWARERGYGRPVIRMEREPGSAGVTVIDHYRRSVVPSFEFKGVPSTGSKETRAAPVAARAEAGDIRICRGRWNTAFLDELTAFPLGAHDDQVDALAGAYEHLAKAGPVVIPIPIGIWRESPWRI